MADDHTIRTPEGRLLGEASVPMQEIRKDVQVREVRPGELGGLEVRRSEAERLTEREMARARLKDSVDALTERANLHVQMQKEPLKMIGGASAVGAVLGLVVGRQFRRSKKIYVDAGSPLKHQKALVKAQQKQGGQSVGGALVAAAVPLVVRLITDRFVTPRLEELSSGLLDRAANPGRPRPVRETKSGAAVYVTPPALGVIAPRPAPAAVPVMPTTSPADAFLKRDTALKQDAAAPAERPVSRGTEVYGVQTSSARSAEGTPGPKAEAPEPAPRQEHVPVHNHNPQGHPKPGPVNPVHPGVVRMPQSRVEAKAVGTPISDAERTNPIRFGMQKSSATTTGPTGAVVTPTHPGVVRMPESQVEAKATGTVLSGSERTNPNVQAAALTSAASAFTGPTGPVVSPVHAGVVRMPESQVDARVEGTPLTDTERGNPNVR